MSLTNLWRGPKPNRHLFAKIMLAGLLASVLIPLSHPSSVQAASITGTWKSATVIESAGPYAETVSYTKTSNGTVPGGGSTSYQRFGYKDGGGCVSYIYFSASTNLTTATSAKFYRQRTVGGQCIKVDSGSVTLTNTQANPDSTTNPLNTTSQGTSTGSGSGSGGGSTIEDNPDACDTKGLNPLTWLLCPVVDMMHKAADFMQAAIVHLMTIDVTGIFDQSTDSGSAYYTAWNSFRVLGIALIIIAGLVMVISQSMGFELFDAYTVKRVLPRLLVAVIGISLSWWLLKFLVVLTNDLGIGIRKLIFLPFQSLAAGQNGIQSLGSSLIGDLGIGAAFLFLGIGGVVTLLGTVLLAALVAFLVLIVRQIVITFLILIAPLAIACYVLPNTDKAYKLWWDSLFKGLMMFPIISAFLAAGAVFSVVASHNTSGDFDLSKIISILAYFLPYFAIPFTFRLAGGAIATLGGLTNDRSRGMFDALKNKRKAIASDRFTRAQNQSLWDNNSRVGRRANKVATWVTDPVSNAALTKIGSNTPGLRKRGARLASVIDSARMEQSGKLFEEANKVFGNNDRAYRAMAGLFDGFSDPGVKAALENEFRDKKTGEWRAPTKLSDFNKLSDILEKSGSETDRTAAHALRAGAGRFATLYQDGEMTKADVRAAGLLGLSAHGFSSGDDIAKTYNAMVGSGDSSTFANTVAQQAQVLVAKSRPDASAGYGITYEQDASGKMVAVSGVQQMGNDGHVVQAQYDANQTLINDDALGLRGFAAIKAKGPGEWAVAKGGAFKGVKDSGALDHMEFILRNGDTDAARAAAAEVASLDAEGKKALRASAEGRRKLRLSDSSELYTGVRDELLQSASYYSHASADVKDSAAKLLTKVGMGDLVKQYDANRSAGHDPREHDGFDDHGGDTPLPGMGDFGGH